MASSNRRISILWISFLLVWAGTQIFFGAVRPWAIGATAILLSILYVAAVTGLPGGHRLSRGSGWFLGAVTFLFVLSFLPVAPLLFPVTQELRVSHGIAGLWPGTADSFLTLRSFAQFWTYGLSALLVLRLMQGGLSPHRVLKGVVLVLLLHLLYAVISFLGGFHQVPFYGESAYPGSATGTLVNRNSFAGLAGMGLVASVALGFSSSRRLESRIAWGAVVVLFLVGIVLSKSRGGAVAALAGLSVLILFMRGKYRVPAVLALLVLGTGALFMANAGPLLERFRLVDPYEIEAETRWQYGKTTFDAAMHQPVLGFGFGTHPRAYHPFQPPSVHGQLQHAHNEYVNILFEAGIVGLLLFCGGLLFWLFRTGKVLRRLAGPMRTHTAAALGAVAVTVVHSMVDFDLRITSIGMLFGVFIAMGGHAFSTAPEVPRWKIWMPALCGLVGGVFLLVLPLDPDRRVEEALSADPDGAEALCSRALGFSPYDYRAAWVRARVSRDVEVADERFSVAADLWPAHPGLQREVGMWFWEGKEVDQSARCFRRFFEQDPGAVESVMKEIWDPEIPVASYEELLPENPVAAAVMAGFLVKRDRWKDAMALFDRRWKGSVRAADLFAIRLQQEGQWGLEATVRERRLERKSDPAAWLATGRTWHRLGRTRRALECADMTVRIDPGNSGGWILSGDVHLGSGEKMKAIESYTRALLLSPENLSLRMKRGRLYLDLKFFELAAEDFREVVRLRPGGEEPSRLLKKAEGQIR